jgi:ribose 1,5-bisphosphate isomerase
MLAEIPEPIRRRIAAIHADHRSGSVALTRRAGEALNLLAGQEPRSGEAFAAQLETSCRLLAAAQPSMAPILNLANSVLFAVGGLRDVDEQCAQVEPAVAAFLNGMETAGQAISKSVAGLLKNGMTVMTHSYSETVRNSLMKASEAGCRFRVIATESRPLGEGAVLAKELGEAGIRVNLIVDAAMMLLLP